MAPKRGTKRQAEAASPVAKKPKVDPAIAGVNEAIEQAADLPESCRKMLLASVTSALGAPSDERHELQVAVVAMIGQVVEAVQAKLQEAVDAQGANVGGVEVRRTDLQAALAAVEEVLTAAKDDFDTKKRTLAQAAEAALSAKGVLQEKQEAQRTGDAAMVQAKESKAALDKGIEVDLHAITEGTSESPMQNYEALLPLLKELALDQSLQSALPSVCAKKAADRGSFDSMVLEQLGQTLRDAAAAHTKVAEEALPASKDREAAVEAAQTDVDAANAAQLAAAQALSAADEAKKAATAAAKVAKDALAAFEPEYLQATEVRDAQAKKLEDFKVKSVGNFEFLRDNAATATANTGGA